MKRILAFLIGGAALAGCVAVPVEPVPYGVYVAPPAPAVVVRESRWYHRHHHRQNRHWR